MPPSTFTASPMGADYLNITARSLGRSARLLSLSGVLSYDTSPRLRSACQEMLKQEQGSVHRLLLDLRDVARFDATGTTTLLELSRDADRKSLRLEIVDRANRPAYVATGLDARLRFVSVKAVEMLER